MNNAKSKSPKKILFAGVVGLIIGSAITFSIMKYFSPNTSPDRELVEKAIDINKYCPAMIDEGTRFDFVNVIPGNKFQFNYSIINASAGYVDTAAAKKFILPNVLKYLKTNPDMNVIRKNKTTVLYNYKDKNGILLFTIPVSPGQYAK